MGNGVLVPLHLAVHVLGLTVALGLAGYAVVQRRRATVGWVGLLVGGTLIATSHIVTGALVAGELGWPIYLRAAGYAALAVGAAGRLAGTAVVVAVTPPAAHIAAAIAGAAAAIAASRGVLGRGRDVLPLALGLGLWSASDLAVRSQVGLAGALSVAGSLSAGWWLLRRTRSSLYARFVSSFVGILLLLVIGLASASGLVFSVDLQRDQLDRLDGLASARADQVSTDWPRELVNLAGPLAGGTLANATQEAASGGADVDSFARSISGLPGVDIAVVVDASGRTVGSWNPNATPPGPLAPVDEADLAGDELVARALTGASTSGLVAFGDEIVALGAVPIAPRDAESRQQLDQLAGALVVARSITDVAVIDQLGRRAGTEAAVLLGGDPAVSTLTADQDDDLAAAVRQSGRSRIVSLGDQRAFLSVVPLTGSDNVTIGALAFALDAAVIGDIEDTFTRSLFLVALAGMAVAAGLAFVVSSRIVGPVARLTDAAERVASGDLTHRIDLDRDDEVGRLAGSFDDMTVALGEREADLRDAAATEAALRGRLEIITSSMGEALLAVDRDGAITTANTAAALLLGAEPEALVGRDVEAVLRGSELGGRSLAAELGSPTSRSMAAVRGSVRGAGPRPIPVSATAAPLVSPGGDPMGRVYVLRDVSGEVEVERMKTEFLSNISHELRTPLTPIKGYAEVMKVKDVGPERTAEFAGNIAASALRLERIIGMLVDFAALEAGRMEVQLSPTDLGSVVDEVLATWRELRPDREFGRRLAKGLPEVRVDPALLRRVFEELIDNAVKFSDDAIRIVAEPGEDGTVRVTVRDRGAGMDPTELDDILRDFHQVDGSATRRFGGLGLGLSIVRRILERFDATIAVRSELGSGTDVVLVLPVAGSR